jgi:tRNA(His) 5'-end guanylyltransferase
MAASKFNQLAIANDIKSRCYDTTLTDCEDTLYSVKDAVECLEKAKLVEFDCKCWNVPNANEAFCHFLWRQHDCVRNSKQQAAQTYLPHKSLVGLETDAQIKLLLDKKGIDWNAYDSGKKYGRLITKELMNYHTLINGEVVNYQRNEWVANGAKPFDEPDALRPLIDNIGKDDILNI